MSSALTRYSLAVLSWSVKGWGGGGGRGGEEEVNKKEGAQTDSTWKEENQNRRSYKK